MNELSRATRRPSHTDSIRRYEPSCDAPWWASGGHLQTLAGHLLPSPAPAFTRASTQAFEIDVGSDERLLAFQLDGTSGVRVHLLHGLSGDVNSDYMRRCAQALQARGHEVWLVNHRGCGEGEGLASEPYHSGKTEDLAAVLRASRATTAARIHVVVGFSLSGNLALLHAGRKREAPQADALIAVNPPIDLARASEAIGEGLCRVYEMRFMHRLRKAIRQREARGLIEPGHRIPLSMSLLEFDDTFTAPACGFESGADYYERCSSAPYLTQIDVPAVIISAADDPFVPAELFETPANAFLHLESSGGHVGYVGRGLAPGTRWIDGAIAHYVDQLASLVRRNSKSTPQ